MPVSQSTHKTIISMTLLAMSILQSVATTLPAGPLFKIGVEKTASTEATLSLDLNLSDNATYKLIIEDNTGDTVFSRDKMRFPYSWNLTDNDGEKVSDGRYNAYVLIKNGLQYAVSRKLTINIVNQK